jgi:pimeloyl-ACP methyl ester carboxylesterase
MTAHPGPGVTADAGAAGPSFGLYLSEPARGLASLAHLPLAAPWLASAPRGDGHGVLVLPGFLASDHSTAVLRRFVRRLGYQVAGWSLGRNRGPTAEVIQGLPAQLTALAGRAGGKVSLIGWSLGGIYAWELARRHPGQVRQVIALGSPFALTDARQSRAGAAYRRRQHLHAPRSGSEREFLAEPLPVPSTAVFSRHDGIVAWQASVAPQSATHENVEVRCAHLGFGADPATLWVIADRLAVPGRAVAAVRAAGGAALAVPRAVLAAKKGAPPGNGRRLGNQWGRIGVLHAEGDRGRVGHCGAGGRGPRGSRPFSTAWQPGAHRRGHWFCPQLPCPPFPSVPLSASLRIAPLPVREIAEPGPVPAPSDRHEAVPRPAGSPRAGCSSAGQVPSPGRVAFRDRSGSPPPLSARIVLRPPSRPDQTLQNRY